MGYIYLYTGNGAGKTTSALGLALRALGHGQNVLVIQFLKWNRTTGEYLFGEIWQKMKDMLEGEGFGQFAVDDTGKFEIEQFSSNEWIGVATLTEKDARECRNGLATAYLRCKSQNINLLILDEINYAVSVGMLEEEDALDCLRRLRAECPDLNIVITGRGATRKLRKIADYVNIIKEEKSSGMVCDEGIQW